VVECRRRETGGLELLFLGYVALVSLATVSGGLLLTESASAHFRR